MKKLIFSTLCLLFLQLSAQAQDSKPFRFGIQTSPTWSWMNTSDKKIEGAGANWGGKLQLMAEKRINSDMNQPTNYFIVSGLGFSFNQGGFLQNNYPQGTFWTKSELSTTNLDTIGFEAKLHYLLTYVEVPFGLKMVGSLGEDSRMRYYAEAPVFTLGFLSRAKGDILGNANNTEDENIRDDVNGLALSWGFGAGVEYELSSNTSLVTGIHFQRGFTDVTDNKASVRLTDTADSAWKQDKSKANIGLITWRVGLFF